MNQDIFGVVMAGGGGTRFWPLSRQRMPKQLLNLSGKTAMINETVDRLSFLMPKKDIFVVTNKNQTEALRTVVEGRVYTDNILSEPCARNTAACVGLAAITIMRKRTDGVMVITPSDAYIRDVPEFTRILQVAVDVAAASGQLVTIGITPTFPSTGYGYIKFNADKTSEAGPVEVFREKPDLDTAKAYVSSGDYLWNSGIFVWKASVIMELLRELAPDIHADLMQIGDAIGTENEQAVIEEIYPKIRNISIDYAVMEPAAAAGKVLTVPGSFGWNDVGSWDTVSVLHQEDAQGNVLVGDTLAIDCRGSVVFSKADRLVSLVGVDNLVVVDTSDAVLVCPKDRAQDVKVIVEQLKKLNRKELL